MLCAEIEASLKNSRFGLLLWEGVVFCLFQILLYPKYCEKMIIELHQLFALLQNPTY